MNKGSRAEINMTPMIDVLLVLLIILMAIAPGQTVGLDALIPRSEEAASRPAPENPVVLEIASDGSYRVNSQLVEVSSLEALLVDVYARRGDRTLFVRGAADLEFGTVARAVDVARQANVERIALMPRQARVLEKTPQTSMGNR
ncbi:MAG: biopolymer transporter ExbD [Bryobacteraceae bacterium]